MNWGIYICIFLPLFIVIMPNMQRKRVSAASKIRKGINTVMFETAKKFIGHKCVVRSIDTNVEWGIVKEVTENSVIMDCNGKAHAVNLEYITCIQENDKKPSILKQFFGME